jgi:spermidine/putrescine transport system permease protein
MMRQSILILMLAFLIVAGGCRKEQAKLHLFAWSEYVPQEVIDGFTKETGIPVDYEVYDSNEAMLSKLAPGSSQYDVIQPSEYAVEHLIHRGMLAPLDFAQIPNIANLEADMRDLPYDPGQKFSVPYMTGTVGIVVNTATVKEPIRGFVDVFQEKYKGRIVVVDDNREIVSWAFSALGIPINDVTPENLAKAKPLLKKWLPLVKVFDSVDPKRPLRGGDVDIGVVYSGDAAMLYQEDPKFQYILPVEGAHQFIDNLCVPAGSAHKAAAYAFINYILEPEVSKIISDKFPYTNPNAAARKLLSKEQLANPASYPKDAAHLEVFHDIGHAAADVSAMMTELRSEND